MARPNIIFIMADDMAAGDLGCCNPQGKIPTPRLAAPVRGGAVNDAQAAVAAATGALLKTRTAARPRGPANAGSCSNKRGSAA